MSTMSCSPLSTTISSSRGTRGMLRSEANRRPTVASCTRRGKCTRALEKRGTAIQSCSRPTVMTALPTLRQFAWRGPCGTTVGFPKRYANRSSSRTRASPIATPSKACASPSYNSRARVKSGTIPKSDPPLPKFLRPPSIAPKTKYVFRTHVRRLFRCAGLSGKNREEDHSATEAMPSSVAFIHPLLHRSQTSFTARASRGNISTELSEFPARPNVAERSKPNALATGRLTRCSLVRRGTSPWA